MGFCKFLYNSETGEVLGRTGSSWGKIAIFYVIFYFALAAFFGLMLYIFYCTLDPKKPKYEGDAGIIGTVPGVGARPQPDQDENVGSTLVWVKKGNSKFWSDQLAEVVKEASSKGKECDFGKGKADDKSACKVHVDKLGPCTAENEFGYKTGQPCMLVKLNNVYGWEPEVYAGKNGKNLDEKKFTDAIEKLNTATARDLNKKNDPHTDKDKDMPKELKDYIIEKVKGQDDANKLDYARSVWISCEGENPHDRENIGPITYYPMPGIPSYYYPFKNQDDFHSPFIMIRFERLIPGVLINVECIAWAKNIEPDPITRLGSVHFEVMFDNK